MTENVDALSCVLKRLRLTAGLYLEASLCGTWALDTSGRHMATFHLVQSGDSWLNMDGETPRRLRPGDFVLFPRDAKHLITSTEQIPESVAVNSPPPVEPDLPITEMLCGYFEFQTQIIWPVLAVLTVIVSGIGIESISNPAGGQWFFNEIEFVLFSWAGIPYKITLLADLFTFAWLMAMIYALKFSIILVERILGASDPWR